MAVLIQDHDCLRAGRDVGVEPLLHARAAGQYDVAIGRSVNRFLGEADRFRGLAAFGIGLVAHHADVAFGDRFLEAFAFFLVNVDGQLVGLDIEARIEDADVAGENADAFLRVEGGFVGINLGRDRLAIRRRSRRARAKPAVSGGRSSSPAPTAAQRRARARRKTASAFHGLAAAPAISFWLKMVMWTLPLACPVWSGC